MKLAAIVTLITMFALLAFLYIRGSLCGVPHTAVPSGGPGLTEFASVDHCRRFPWQRENGQGTDIPLPVNEKPGIR